MRRTAAKLWLAVLPACPALADLTADQTPFHTFRGIWIDRFDYSVTNARTQIPTIMQNCANLGFTDVMFQIRGQADAYYYLTGGLETRVSGVTSSNDPLAIAVAEAHARGIRVHAYINTVPFWNGTAPPTDPNHVYNKYPEWRAKDANGVDQPLTGGYVMANPANDGFRTHLNAVVQNLATQYNIDGIHLDYIRLYYSNPGSTNPIEYPADPATVAQFQLEYPGQTPTSNPANYKSWMADRISTLVASIKSTLKSVKPVAQLTASVWRDADIGLDSYQQDWARWVAEGSLDAVMPMIYRKGFAATDSGDLYRLNVTAAMDRISVAGIMPGLGTYLQSDAPAATYQQAYDTVMSQLAFAKSKGANGIQVFDYGTLYNGTAAQQGVQQALRDFFSANSSAPADTSISGFEMGEDYFPTNPTYSGSNRNIAATSTADRVTIEARTGVGSQKLVINKVAGAPDFLLRHLAGIGTPGDFNSNLQMPSIGTVGFWLKTTTPDLQVTIALDDTATGDRGYFQNVIPDGQWHKYEWFLNDPSHWDTWPGVGGNGFIASIFSIDSIQFTGTQNAVVYLDDVFHSPAAVAPNQWVADASANWSTPVNWTGGVPNGVGASANLLRRVSAARTITIDKPVTLGSLRFDNIASYTVGGSALISMDAASGNASITVVNRGAHTIAVPISLADATDIDVDHAATLNISGMLLNPAGRAITKKGAGTLAIRGQQVHGSNAALTVDAGTLRLETDAGSAATANLALTVNAGGLVSMQATQHLRSLRVAGRAALAADGDRLLHTRVLTMESGGVLDLANHDMIVQSTLADRMAAYADIRGWVASARNGPALWQGPGITSSSAAANVLTGLGVLLNDANPGGSPQPFMTSFDGHSVSASSILVKYTWNGDTDLDGDVDADDFFRIDKGFFRSSLSMSGGFGWADGDFDYDGDVDIQDYILADSAFLGQSRGLIGTSIRAVPEPAALAVGALIMLACRRRRLAP